jgi:hypothetical protein
MKAGFGARFDFLAAGLEARAAFFAGLLAAAFFAAFFAVFFAAFFLAAIGCLLKGGRGDFALGKSTNPTREK